MSKLFAPVGSDDHVLGSTNAAVTLTEYGDYECPYCGRAHHVVKLMLEEFGDDLRLAFRNFPLAQAHPYALIAAEAAEAAGAQGAFWPMHDTLYENQYALELDDLVGYAEMLELDRTRFLRDLQTDTYLAKIKADFRSGVRSGVNGTPTFFVEDERLDAGWGAEVLRAALESAVARKRGRSSQRGSGASVHR